MKSIVEEYDVVVCGGGLAGFCAAVAAARSGVKTCLVQDRPVLGGNSSSEIRVTPHGAAAFHGYARETGIISEILIEERARNHEEIFENGWTNSVWDLVLYDLAQRTPNLTLKVNTAIFAVETAGRNRITAQAAPDAIYGLLHRKACAPARRLEAVVGRVANAEVELTLRAQQFIDCTGDGLVADLAGCEWRMGSEGREEFDEPHAPPKPSRDTMGNSIHFRARDMGQPVPFAPPDWAVKHTDAAYFYNQGRQPKDVRGGYWWLEIGVPWDTIYDAEDIRHELTRHALGVWDWIKNRDPLTRDLAANFALDWIGQVPGKRESRRIMGRYLVTEHDVQERRVYNDEVAFGGWFLDLHTPGGLLAPTSEPASAEGYAPTSVYSRKSYVGPYGLPLRALIAKDLDNLMMAGRNISATHAALGTARVMSTTALMGQAAGTACAQAIHAQKDPAQLSAADLALLQQRLLRDGCFLPSVTNCDAADLARTARVAASSSALSNGAGPDAAAQHRGLLHWKDQAVPTGRDELHQRRGQWIAVASPKVDSLSLYISNLAATPQPLELSLLAVDHIWDYRVDGAGVIAKTTLIAPPGLGQWITWSVGATVAPGTYIRLDAGANPQVCWHQSPALLPGHLSAFEMGGGQMRRYSSGVTLAFRIEPAQRCYEPGNAISGATRPHRWTNLWRSDPTLPLPQSLELSWATPQEIQHVELTFPGHLVREYHAYQPFYKDAQCPRDYMIDVYSSGAWQTVVTIAGNYQRHRRHRLESAVHAEKVRVVIQATNGDPAAAIYEIRAYGSGS